VREWRLRTPLREEDVLPLRAGDWVHLSGVVYGARDAAHQRMAEALRRGQEPPIPLRGQVIYYVGPAPAKEGWAVGPAGPTTSGRMDPFTVPLLERGLKATVGKGTRSPEVRQAMVRHRAVYLATVGGGAALLARHILRARPVAYEDLGTEAIWELEFRDFPAVVVNDVHGGDLYTEASTPYARA
jgi:fumarate hydratase subunit beta